MDQTREQIDAMFPKLTDEQIKRLESFGEKRGASQGEILYDQGDSSHGVFVMLEGSVEIVSVLNRGEELIQVLRRGQFTGEINQLSGRRSLVRCRTLEPSSVMEIGRADLRRIFETDSGLSELFLRAFLARRLTLIGKSYGDALLIGSSQSSHTLRLREFLSRNSHPFTYVDVERDADVQAILDQFNIQVSDIPVLICRGELVLRNPTNAEAAECFGLNTGIDEEGVVYDLIVIGAGPSGLAAAVYGASEGLKVLVVESTAPGGQAGSSSRIENYLGFPMGISGQELAGRAFIQAEKFGAQIAIARTARGLRCNRSPYTVDLDDGKSVQGRSVIIASGAQYRRLALANLSQFECSGVYYGATLVEAQLCQDEEVAVVGGGNSAGQAAMFLSEHAKRVHLLVRGPGLADSMSRYLIARIDACANITFRPWTEVEALEGDPHLKRIRWRQTKTGEVETHNIQHLFSMTGACPNTPWLNGCVALDSKHFIKTGPDVGAEWKFEGRHPYLLETSLPGVFAVGDVRSGSVKRVAAAVGEGSMAVQFIHRVLAE